MLYVPNNPKREGLGIEQERSSFSI